jgi:aspartate aminotransferase
VAGYPELRQADCEKLKRDNNLDYKPENIVVSTGAKQSLANAILAVVDEGDEVIIPAPFWVTYSELVKIAGGVPVILSSKLENDYKVTADEVAEAITERTKLFLFSSPCNPSGAVYNKAELLALAKLFSAHPDIFIISDEIYEYINFVGAHESIAQFDDVKERVIIINGLSKGYAMTGYRLGYIAASPEVAKACEKIQGQFTSGANSVTQRAGIVALTGDMRPTEEMEKEFERRKKRVMELLSEIPGWKCSEPDGAFYVFPDVSAYFGKSANGQIIENADDLCMYLLNTAHVSTVTGRAFGSPECIRLSFANSLPKIEAAYARIKDALAKLK